MAYSRQPSLSAQMREAASQLLNALPADKRVQATYPFTDDDARRWIEYRPRQRPGACLADFDVPARKASMRLLATGLSPGAFAQAMVVVALEEVLDREERWRGGRHSGDYWVAVFGDPTRDDDWSWRFEGHHLSVTMTAAGDEVSPAPVFLGAHPARIDHAGLPVVRPLAPEEDLARGLLLDLSRSDRMSAVVSDQAPDDIRSSTRPTAQNQIEPLGVPASRLTSSQRGLLRAITAVYLDRLPAELASRETSRVTRDELYFAWAGPPGPGTRHYYRIQGEDLLIEYDNTTDDGNHAHTVLRRPRSDYGDDVLSRHRLADHQP